MTQQSDPLAKVRLSNSSTLIRTAGENLLPNQLTPAEYRELHQESAIHPDLIKLNFVHLEEHDALDRLFISEKLPRTNAGTVSASLLKRYRHVEAGGWWVSGVNVLNDYADDLYGQFKPTEPRLSEDKGKVIKYEGPPKYPTGIIALKVSWQLWQAIASKHNLEIKNLSKSTSFWEWVVNNPEVPLIITEGAKKAACLISAGYPAIALPGIFNGYRQPKDEFGRKIGLAKLIPQLEVFARSRRKIYFAFDKDNKAKTIANVRTAISRTGKLFAKAEAEVKVIRWQEKAKGVDDLIVRHGAEAFHNAFSQALSLETWLVRTSVGLTYKANIRVNRRFLGEGLEAEGQRNRGVREQGSKGAGGQEAIEKEHTSTSIIPHNAKLIGIKSPKGTGKTRVLEEIVDDAIKKGKWVLLLTHRIQLGEALCQRVGLPYLTEIKTVEYGSVLGYGLCIDSLHPNSGARFNADNWSDGIVIIDEAEQVIWHMLNSATCAAERVSILDQFKTLIQNNLSGDGKVYLADADLSDVAIDYIRSLAGFHVDPFVIVNDWQPPKEQRWTVHNYEDKNPARLMRDLVGHIEAGGRPFISCSAQKLKSKYGTQNLESYLKQEFPDKKILRIDSQTVADPSHPAYGCIAHLNEILPDYDIAIASPSIETGVSIECENIDKSNSEVSLAFQLLLGGINTNLGKVKQIPHFDSVWAIAQGVQTADSIRQALARIRANVPRFLWAAKRGFHKCMVGNGATVKKALIASTRNKASKNIRFLQTADTNLRDLDLDTNFQPESLNTWAKRGCYINLTMQNYRVAIVDGLVGEGHLITSPPQPNLEESNPPSEVESQLKQVAATKYEEDCMEVANAPMLTDAEYQKLKDKRAKTRQEMWSERKVTLQKRYGNDVFVSPELVKKDDEGWYSKILSHYYLTVGRPYLIERDSRQIRAFSVNNKNRLWLPDFNRSLLSTSLRLLETLILGLLKTGVEYRGRDPNLQLIAELAIANKTELKTFLGLTIVESDTPIKIVQKLLSLLGLKLTYIGRFGSREKRERVYVFEPVNDGREEIFASWLQRDITFAQNRVMENSDSILEKPDLISVSTIGKDNNSSSALTTRKDERNIIQPGAIVKWLKAKGEWIVEATTGMVVKIKNALGKEKIVHCQELGFYYKNFQ